MKAILTPFSSSPRARTIRTIPYSSRRESGVESPGSEADDEEASPQREEQVNGAPVTGIADHGELVGGGAVQDRMDRRSTYEKQAAGAEQHGERPK